MSAGFSQSHTPSYFQEGEVAKQFSSFVSPPFPRARLRLHKGQGQPGDDSGQSLQPCWLSHTLGQVGPQDLMHARKSSS